MEPVTPPPLDALLTAARARAEASDPRTAPRDDPRALRRAAKEFEGVFLNQLLRAMRATVPENELFGGGGPEKFYRQLHDSELAKGLAEGRGGLGIADLIVRQFAPDTAGPPPPTALARYRVHGAAADAPRRRAELEAVARRAAPAERDTLARWRDDLRVAAARHDVPAPLLLAVIMEESGGDPAAVSDRGARGLMQLMPATAREMGVTDPHRGGPNIAGGARYLREQLDRFDDRLDLALAAYNAGPGAVERAGRAVPEFPETRRYVRRVIERYRRLDGGTEMAMAPR